MSSIPLPPYRKGDTFNPGINRRLRDAVNASFVQGGDGVDVLSSPAGQTIVNTRPWIFTEMFLGEILDTGPLGTEDDFTGNQYWIRRKRPTVIAGETLGSLATRKVGKEDDDAPDGDKIATGDGFGLKATTVIVATDIFDDDAARNYEAEQTVLILAVEGKVGTNGTERAYVIIRPEAGTGDPAYGLWFVLTGVAAVGKYYAKPIIPLGTPIDPAADLTYGADVGTNPTDAVLLINVAELANDTGTPWLSQLNAGNVFFATHWGETNEDPPKAVFIMHGVHNAPCEEP